MLKDLILKNRSYRRFAETERIDRSKILEWIELARLSNSARNLQPLKFYISVEAAENENIFSCLSWAGYLGQSGIPKQGEKPAAYVIVLGNKELTDNFYVDHGIAAHSILLGAVESGYGGCIIASIKRENLQKHLQIPDVYDILLVLAIGKPAEQVEIVPVNTDGDIKYYRDDIGTHFVPKRSLESLVIEKF